MVLSDYFTLCLGTENLNEKILGSSQCCWDMNPKTFTLYSALTTELLVPSTNVQHSNLASDDSRTKLRKNTEKQLT